ncbi:MULTISPECIES: hypothetical protein [Eikenella]|nr:MULTISPECIES: hypothetical protein [Eikenella]
MPKIVLAVSMILGKAGDISYQVAKKQQNLPCLGNSSQNGGGGL